MIDHVSSASSVSDGCSSDVCSDGDVGSRQQLKKKQRGSSPVFDVVAFFDRLSTR